MHKLHALKFPLHNVIEGFANAPLPLPSNDFLEAMGRTNDAISIWRLVQLVVSGNDSESETCQSFTFIQFQRLREVIF